VRVKIQVGGGLTPWYLGEVLRTLGSTSFVEMPIMGFIRVSDSEANYMLRKINSLRAEGVSREAGFTLIELLVIISIIGILAALSISSYRVYISSAGNAVAKQSLEQARIALEASVTEPDSTYPAVNVNQASQGPMLDPNAALLLPAFQVSRQTRVSVYHDPVCADASCLADQLTVRHCRGLKYSYWVRFGDGADALVEDLPGVGC
jgi:prepilin-type N-terminal cleavage/methylation domain-containing protein